jgi:ATP-dependent Clp protease ATP-binding subunit ClpB
MLMAILDPIIKTHFRPEFINRLDDILPFLALRKEDMQKIVEIQLNYLAKRMRDRGVNLRWTKEVTAHLAEDGYDPFFGARPLKRLIQQDVVNLLSKAILAGQIPAECTVELKYDGKKGFTFDVK